VRQPECQVAIVGEQHQAFGVDVEPSDRVQPMRSIHQVDHGRSPLGVMRGAHDAYRLVERNVVVRGLAARQRSSVDFDAIATRVDLCAKLEHECAVDPHAVVTNHALRGAARGDTGVREHLVQPLAHGG
jgi:hypothetical protein